jgi:hypothetical protein
MGVVRSLVAVGVHFALAFLVGLPIFAGFKLARRVLVRDDPMFRPTGAARDSQA